jgi:hypothetical protein
MRDGEGNVAMEYTERGRWGGRLTRRPLATGDGSIDELSPEERRLLAETWILRAAMERRVADSFIVVLDALLRRGAGAELQRLAERAIDDEYRHAELSRRVASRYAGRALPAPARLPLETPRHRGAPPALRDSLHIVGQCVLNETTAGAYLEVSLAHATAPFAVSALREILSDEIDHGRIGWAHLASLDGETRAAVARWMLPMAFVNLRVWRKESAALPHHPEALTRHGVPPAAIIHAALVDAVQSLVVPGLRMLGMETGPLEQWLRDGATTERPPRFRG